MRHHRTLAGRQPRPAHLHQAVGIIEEPQSDGHEVSSAVGALLASIPYYVWRGSYPNRAKTYNRHVWIAFGISCVLWIGLVVVGQLAAHTR